MVMGLVIWGEKVKKWNRNRRRKKLSNAFAVFQKTPVRVAGWKPQNSMGQSLLVAEQMDDCSQGQQSQAVTSALCPCSLHLHTQWIDEYSSYHFVSSGCCKKGTFGNSDQNVYLPFLILSFLQSHDLEKQKHITWPRSQSPSFKTLATSKTL